MAETVALAPSNNVADSDAIVKAAVSPEIATAATAVWRLVCKVVAMLMASALVGFPAPLITTTTVAKESATAAKTAVSITKSV